MSPVKDRTISKEPSSGVFSSGGSTASRDACPGASAGVSAGGGGQWVEKGAFVRRDSGAAGAAGAMTGQTVR